MNRRRTEPALPSWRRGFLLGLFALVAATLEARLVWLQLFQADFLTAEGNDRQLREVEVSAHRGIIRDRNGEPLAVSTPVDSLFVNPQKIPSDRDLIFELAAAVGRDGSEVEREITSRMDREFVWLKRRLPPSEASDVLALGIDGVDRQREYTRFYPQAEVTCHLVGFAGDEDIGQEGLEYAFDGDLAGEPGRKLVQRDRRGRVISDVEQIEPVRPGRDVTTSIDLRLQYPAYRALKSAVVASGASSGSLVLLDVWTGEVLAMANQPVCNPNALEQRADASMFRNRAITDPIEPGSAIKPLILAAALANGLTPETRIDVPRELVIEGQRLTEDSAPLGYVSVTEILARSSSVGMGMIGAELDSEGVWRTLKAFGVGELAGDELGSLESKGVFGNDYANWKKRWQATLSYGYGLSVTPLQLARAYAAIAAGGLLPRVSFTARDEPAATTRAISPEIASELMTMLEVVVSDQGTASRAAIPNYRVAGKTGTAEITDGGRYSDDMRRAIFAGIAPASRPRFVAVVVISDPRGQAYHGGDVAAPVFARVMATALRIYGIAPDDLPESMLVSHAEVAR